MTYNICSSYLNISSQALKALREGRFDEISHVNTFDVSYDESIPLKRTPIEWTPSMGMKLLEVFSERSYPYRKSLKDLRIEGFFRELELFAISLDAYIESGFKIPPEKIIYLASIGEKGSSILKQARKELFLRKIDAEKFVSDSLDPLVEDLIKDLPLDDIDTVFNYRHMPLWKETVNDLEEVSNIPVNASERYINEFRQTLQELLKDVIITDEDKRVDILLSTSRSISLEGSNKIRNFLRNQSNLNFEENFSTKIGVCERSIIPVGPQSFRDAVILDWKSTNTVRLIEYRVRKILEYLPYHNYTDTNERFYDEVNRFYRYGYTYVCRDIRKEGLTKPRYLLKIMLEELSKKDKILEPYTEFFESFEIKDFGVPERGHGQGMANALTTLMQIVLIQMVNNILSEQGFEECVTALCYNDDNVTRVPTDILDEFWDIEGKIMGGLSLIRSDKKSFHSKLGFIYCEVYKSPIYPSANIKQMVSRRNVLFSLLYDFPYEAKEFIQSQGGNPYLKDYFMEIFHTFGYEFFPEELDYPISIGGWTPDNIQGFSRAILDLDNLDYDIRVYCMYLASKINSTKIPLSKRVLSRYYGKNSIFNKLFPDICSDLGKYLPVGEYKDLHQEYGLWRDDPRQDFLSRKLTHSRRRSRFYRKVENFPTLEEFQLSLLQTGKFIFPRWACRFEEPEFFSSRILRDPYKQDTPLLNYLQKLGIIFNTYSPYTEEYSIERESFSFKLRKDEIFFTTPEEENEQLHGIPFSVNSFYTSDRFVANTARFLLAHYLVYQQIPIIPDDYGEHPLKKEVYGHYLTLDDYIEMSNVTYDRWNYHFLKLVENLVTEKDLDTDELQEIIEDSRELPIVSESSSEDSSDEEISPEEADRLRELYNRKLPDPELKKLTVDSLQAILLGKESPEEYEYSSVLWKCTAPVLFFYNYHDSSSRYDKHERLKNSFEEFLSIEYLKNLLISCCEEGYLRDIGESLGIYITNDSDEDFGLSIF